ncbi:hypothetical protein [Kitasatospora sp. NPDC088783]|uniref:hypothetical protein n=1 Tax=Kitasatospora sp. NPDC088783 TaxID=3364077 RepID=UPI00380431DC
MAGTTRGGWSARTVRRAVPEAAAQGAVLVPLPVGRPPNDTAARRPGGCWTRRCGRRPGTRRGVAVRPVVTPGPASATLAAAVGGPDDRRHRHHRHGLPHLRGTRTAHHRRAPPPARC